MNFLQLFSDYSLVTIVSLVVLSFVAGFIDAVVGGGGLIQIPALLISLPNQPLATVFGTNKIASLSGTSVAAYQYSRRVRFDFRLLLVIAAFSFVASYVGAKTVSLIHVDTLKPIVLIILILMAVYTFIKKDLGSVPSRTLSVRRQLVFGSLIGLVVGFYDGFFGPGTGSFFVLGFVVILGFEFLTASAYAKIINCITNVSALIVFVRQGNFLPGIALLMAVFNVMGSVTGSRMALKKGNGFIRVMFLVIVSLMILRYAYDIFVKQ